MSFLFFCRRLAVMFLMWPCFVAQAQSSALPATPVPSTPLLAAPKAAKPSFTLPPETVAAPKGPPPASPMVEQMCYAPAEGLYAPHKQWTPAQKQQMDRYTDLVMQQIDSYWSHHLPRAVNDPWVKGKQVVVRFAVLPNGSYDSPIVTVSSGREDFDKHALDSVGSFASFPPPPEGVGNAVPFCIHFRYNMTSEHESKPVDLWPTKPAAKP